MKQKSLEMNLLVIALLLIVCNAYGDIVYSPSYTIEQDIEQGRDEFDFKFEIKSRGSFNILKIEKTCGCTTVDLDKWTYNSNDIGILSGKINLNDKLGEQIFKITVLTDAVDSPTLTYTVHLRIPRVVNLKPGLLFWKRNTSNISKQACIQLFDSAIFVSAKSLSENFQCKAVQDPRDCSKFIVSVTPIKTSDFMHGKIALKVRRKDNVEKSYNLHLLIR